MPSAAPANDVRVRTPVSLAGQLPLLDLEPSKQPSHCQTTAATAQRQHPSSSNNTTRPALNRNLASHTSIGSGETDSSTYLQSDDGSGGTPDFGDTIDSTTFEQVCHPYSEGRVCDSLGDGGWVDMRAQILEMDDDEDEREFSKSIVYDFFTQADGTFQKMDKSMQV